MTALKSVLFHNENPYIVLVFWLISNRILVDGPVDTLNN